MRTGTDRPANLCLGLGPDGLQRAHALALVVAGLGLGGVPAGAAPQDPDALPPGPSHLGAYVLTIEGLAGPTEVAFGPSGDLWIAESEADRVLRVSTRGDVREAMDGVGFWSSPEGLAVDTRLYVSDAGHRAVLASTDDWQHPDPIAFPAPEPCEPAGLDARDGRLAVADPLGGRAYVLGPEGRVVLGEGLLARPVDVALGTGGEVWVLDADRARVERFSPAGEHRGGFGDWGAFPGLLSDPGGLAWWGGRLFVADTANHRVQVFDEVGERLYVLGTHAIRPREGEGKLHYPSDVAVSRDGRWLAVAEPLDDRVQLFERAPGAKPPVDPLRQGFSQATPHHGPDLTADGTWLLFAEPEGCRVQLYDTRRGDDPVRICTIATRGEGLGRLVHPAGLWVDQAARALWVCDPGGRSLQEFRLRIDPEAPLSQELGAAAAVRRLDLDAGLDPLLTALPHRPRPRAVARRGEELLVLDAANRALLVLGPDLATRAVLGRGHLVRPEALAVAPDGRVWVADALALELRAFDPDGEPDAGPVDARGIGWFKRAAGVAVDAEGRVYASDAARHHVHRFDGPGRPAATHGAPGLGRGELYKPRGLAFDGQGRLVVDDHANHRGVLLTPDLDFVHAFGPRLYTRPANRPDAAAPDGEDGATEGADGGGEGPR